MKTNHIYKGIRIHLVRGIVGWTSEIYWKNGDMEAVGYVRMSSKEAIKDAKQVVKNRLVLLKKNK